jgi:hypothetical protein
MTVLLGVMGNQARAGAIMVSIDLGGTIILSPTALVPGTIADINVALAHDHSIYRLSTTGGGLSATSNFPGGAAGVLQSGGQVNIVAGTDTDSLSIHVTQSGFLSPVGMSGILSSTASGTYTPGVSGTTSYTSDLNLFSAPSLNFTLAASPTGGSFSQLTPSTSPVPSGVPSGYELSNTFVINIPTSAVGGSETFGGQATVTASSIPEPASVVMLLTGMPLPLAMVFGLIRRRRAGARA